MTSTYAGERVRAPDFPPDRVWLNSPPLSLAGLKGKVVLVDIWDYTCINCLRTLPYLNEWHRRYARFGLVVVGVHTPEFDFAASRQNVKAALDKLGIAYPVVLDNDRKIWSLYANQYWPREYLIDGNGYIVYDHAGEGGYRETERMIQKYLAHGEPGAVFPGPYTAPGAAESGALCYPVTPELHLGYFRGRLGNREGYAPETVVLYRDEGVRMDSFVYANGPWLNLSQSLKHARPDPRRQDYIAVRYHALSVNAVLHPSGGGAPRVYVLQDGAPVAREDGGEDLRFAPDGACFLEVDSPRLYRVVRNREFGEHLLSLHPEPEGVEIYSFTFGSCMKP